MLRVIRLHFGGARLTSAGPRMLPANRQTNPPLSHSVSIALIVLENCSCSEYIIQGLPSCPPHLTDPIWSFLSTLFVSDTLDVKSFVLVCFYWAIDYLMKHLCCGRFSGSSTVVQGVSVNRAIVNRSNRIMVQNYVFQNGLLCNKMNLLIVHLPKYLLFVQFLSF